MPAPPNEIARAAHLAAQRLEAMLVEMLEAGQVGEVAIVVSISGLDPEKRVTTKGKTVRVARGIATGIETVSVTNN